MRRLIIAKSEADFTSHAGLELIGMVIRQHTDLAKAATAVAPARSDAIPHVKILISYIGLLCLGKSDFEAIEAFRHDPYFAEALDVVTGTLLAQGPRTVAAALRIMGLAHEPRFERDHRVLSGERWSGVQGSQILLGLLMALLPSGWPTLVVVNETLERRKGARVAAKGMYRDAVRSSNSRVVTCLGLQWVCMALIVLLPWSQRPWALPFLTLLAPSQRANVATEKAHRTVIDWAVVMVRLVARGLTRRRWVPVGDGSYSCVRLGWGCFSAQTSLISRLRLDARLFAPLSPVPSGRRGPKPQKGPPLAKLATRLAEARTHGTETTGQWYRGETKTRRLLSGVCLWHIPGWSLLPIRWVLIVDPADLLAPEAFFITGLSVLPVRVIEWFVLRWSIEVTFAEVRRHLGGETQRQWSAKAIARTTPALLTLFSIVCLIVLAQLAATA